MDDPPPPYSLKDALQASIQQAPQSTASTTSTQSQSSIPAPTQQQTLIHPLHAYLHTHQPLGLYHAGLSDLCLSTRADSPPLCHITIHSLRTPSIALHSSGTAQSPVIAIAQYNFLSATDVNVAPQSAGRPPLRAQMQKTGWLPDAWGFEMPLPGSARREQFEWKHSRGPEVAALEGRNRGLKCVRVATGEVVCAWAWTGVSARKVGKLRWVLGERWGEEVELMILVTLLAVVERVRRDESSG